MELVAGARKAPEPQALEAVMRLQVGEAHLDPLPLIARFQERLCLHFAASDVAGSLINVAHDPARRRVGAAPLFHGALTAAEHGCEVADCMIGREPLGAEVKASSRTFNHCAGGRYLAVSARGCRLDVFRTVVAR
jgi:hypothetical protein